MFSCHRNTVSNIKKLVNKNIKTKVMEILTTDRYLTFEEIENNFNFLLNRSTRPKSNKKSLNQEEKKIVVDLFVNSNYSYRRIANHLKQQGKDTAIFTEGKIRKVLKDNQGKKRRTRTVTGQRRDLYDYQAIEAFECLQYDTKHILDQHALPQAIYDKFQYLPNLPIYQWTIIDVKTRIRFLAWSHSLSSTFGMQFLTYTINWLRAHGITRHIKIQCDMGSEFYSGSKKKQVIWNVELESYNAEIYDTEGQKWKQNIIERSHRIDDEWFYCPRGTFISTRNEFIFEAQKWIINYNNRPHYGKYMAGATPQQKLSSLGYYNSNEICNFPCLILEDFFTILQNQLDPSYAQNVLTFYHLQKQMGYLHLVGFFSMIFQLHQSLLRSFLQHHEDFLNASRDFQEKSIFHFRLSPVRQLNQH